MDQSIPSGSQPGGHSSSAATPAVTTATTNTSDKDVVTKNNNNQKNIEENNNEQKNKEKEKEQKNEEKKNLQKNKSFGGNSSNSKYSNVRSGRSGIPIIVTPSTSSSAASIYAPKPSTSAKTTSKRGAPTNTPPPLPGSNETLLSSDDLKLMEQFKENRGMICCPKCSETGTINKNGHTRNMKQPRPQFVCKSCKQLITIQQIEIEITSVTGSNKKRLTERIMQNQQEDIISQQQQQTESSIIDEDDSYSHISDDILMENVDDIINNNNNSVNNGSTDNSVEERISMLEKSVAVMNQIIQENTELKNEMKILKNIIKNMQTEKNTEQLIAEKNTKKNTKKNNNIANNNTTNYSNTLSLDIDLETDYPNLPTGTGTYQTIKETPLSYAQVTKNKKKQFKKKINRYRANNPTEKELIIAERIFQERAPEDINKFLYVYVPVHRRMRSNEIRKKLTLLGIDNIQVLDCYCPDWCIAAILVHEKYVETITEKFSKAKIILRYDYNHLDPIHIRDPKLQSLSVEQKLEQSKKIFNNNMMRALTGMRNTARYSVARSFFRDNYITLEQLQSVLKGNTNNNNSTNNTGFVISSITTDNNNNNNSDSNNTQDDIIMDENQLALLISPTLDTPSPPTISKSNE
jgi:hypothetical protein